MASKHFLKLLDFSPAEIDHFLDVAAYLKTLEMVKNLDADLFVPAHAAAAADVLGKQGRIV